MSDDLYTRWIGIAPGQRPPDYYTLLALPLFTHTINAIEAAARAQMEKLDPYAMHPDRELRDASTRMMNKIAQARMVLADPVRRDEYDRELSQQRGIDVPGTGEHSPMEETIAGGAPVMDSGLDINAFNEPESADLGFQAAPQDVVSESLFQGQTPLQDFVQTSSPTRTRRNAIPFSVLVLMGLMGLAVVVGGIVILVVVFNQEKPATKKDSQPSQQQIVVAPPKPEQFKFTDEFDQQRLGASYEIRAGDSEHVQVNEGKLILGSADESTARVDLTPRLVRTFFRRVDVAVHIEPGSAFTMGVTRSARLTIRRGSDNLLVRVTPGSLVQSDNMHHGVLTLPAEESITATLLRDEMDNVAWYINGNHIATSPELSKRDKYPAITLRSAGGAGHRVAIESINVTYDPDENQ